MRILKNMKIRNKLFLGFTMILAITVMITAYGGWQIINVDRKYTYAMTYPAERLEILNEMSLHLMNARRTMNRAAMYIHDPDDPIGGITRQQEGVSIIRADMVALFERFRANVYEDIQLDARERTEMLNSLAGYEQEVFSYFDEYILGLIVAARTFDERETIRIVREGVATVGRAEAHHASMHGAAQTHMQQIGITLTDQSWMTLYALIALAATGIVTSIITAYIISSMITKPIEKVITALGDVAKGKLNINIDRANITTEETGTLTRDVIVLTDTIKTMIDDFSVMKHEFVVVGDFEHRVDTKKYQNSFRDMVEGVHAIIDDQVNDIFKMFNFINKVNDGDFKITIEDMPGKKAIMPQTLRGVIANLESVMREINGMIHAAAVLGDLHYRIDEDKFKGNWREIMVGLDHIAESVDKPIVEIRDVMDKLARGNFSLKVTGDYAGDFLVIKNAINSTMDALSTYIAEIAEDLGAISKGDLTTVITREYVGSFSTIKISLNHISQALHKTMTEIAEASSQVSSSARQISTSSAELASGAQEQASSVEELNSTIDTINHQTQQNAVSAQTATDLSNKSTSNAQDGNRAMKHMVEAMTQIKESSNNISKIVKTIQDIAFQTNLLALNASVEAARAGEHGKGFAVVADEVRSLAGRSQTAATETTSLIQDSISRVESGSNIAESTAESLDAIVKSAGEVLDIIRSISEASKEQAEAIGQISDGLGQISRVVQNNSAVSEETAAASEELSSQADVLKQLVGYFKL